MEKDVNHLYAVTYWYFDDRVCATLPAVFGLFPDFVEAGRVCAIFNRESMFRTNGGKNFQYYTVKSLREDSKVSYVDFEKEHQYQKGEIKEVDRQVCVSIQLNSEGMPDLIEVLPYHGVHYRHFEKGFPGDKGIKYAHYSEKGFLAQEIRYWNGVSRKINFIVKMSEFSYLKTKEAIDAALIERARTINQRLLKEGAKPMNFDEEESYWL